MTPQDFLDAHRDKLIETLDSYLQGKLSHEAAAKYSWDVIDAWDEVRKINSKYVKGEGAFWSSIWALQHLADKEHWSDGVTQLELSECLTRLIGNVDTPASRPLDARNPRKRT